MRRGSFSSYAQSSNGWFWVFVTSLPVSMGTRSGTGDCKGWPSTSTSQAPSSLPRDSRIRKSMGNEMRMLGC